MPTGRASSRRPAKRFPITRKTTIEDVALAAGVSIATVSRVINDAPYPVSGSARRRVLRVVQELSFHPNALARSLHFIKWP